MNSNTVPTFLKSCLKYTGFVAMAIMVWSGLGNLSLHAQTFPTPTGFTLPAGKTITITYEVDVDAPMGPIPANISNQASVSGNNFSTVLTDDPDIGGASDPTLTPWAAPDYIITTTGNAIVVTDDVGNSDIMSVSENGSDIRFDVAGRTYALNGASLTSFPVDIPLAGVASITLNGEAGDDTFDIGTFTANLPDLAINGGTGDDVVNFNGDITFAADAHLDLDMQNDDATPGEDQVRVAANANLVLSGTGTATIKVSRNVAINSDARIETANGNLTIEANQQATPTTGSFVGVSVNGSVVEVTGTGSVTLIGQGGDANANEQIGVQVISGGAIRTNSGMIDIDGQGGGSGSRHRNYGFRMHGAGSEITTTGGSVTVTGTAGSTTGNNNKGILADVLTSFNIGGSGSLELIGTGGSGTDQNTGVEFLARSSVTVADGDLIITGTGGGDATGSTSRGVFIGSSIDVGGNGTVTITGTGGVGSGGNSPGILFETSAIGADISDGVLQAASGDILIEGIGGGGSGSEGLKLNNNSSIESASGSNITLIADEMNFAGDALITTAADVTLWPRTAGTAIDLGGADATGTLGLTDEELDIITAGTLVIGRSDSGPLTVSSDITRPAATPVELRSGGDIVFSGGQFDTNGETLLLSPGDSPAAVKPTTAGVDVTASTLSFASDLAININGTTVDTEYDQLKLVGTVDLTGVDLMLDGSYTPALGNFFIIVDNDGVDAVTGTFSGLPEGAAIPNFLGSGQDGRITYMGGDGNDVVITVMLPISISGSIVWEHDGTTPVPDATVTLSGDDTGSDGTDANGDYAIPTGGGNSLTLTPEKTGLPYQGVDAADVTRIQQHVTFIDRFDDGYKVIAADVNLSNSVTGLDAAVIFHAINGNPNAEAIFEDPSWRFVDSTHTFMDENAPWPFPEDISLMNVMADVMNQSFVGVKMGDVNGTWAAPVLLTSPPLSLMVQDQALKAGQTLRIPFRANGLPDVAAWQFALRFDTDYLRFERALPTAAFPLKDENFGAWQADRGELRSVFAVPQGLALPKDEVIFELEFRVVYDGLRLSEVLRLDNDILNGRVYDTALSGGGVALTFEAVETRRIASLLPGEASLGFALEQNIPNPFRNETLVRFELPEAGETVFSVHDALGRLLYEQRGFLDAGLHEVRLDAARLGATGVLSYTLRVTDAMNRVSTGTRRMVLVR